MQEDPVLQGQEELRSKLWSSCILVAMKSMYTVSNLPGVPHQQGEAPVALCAEYAKACHQPVPVMQEHRLWTRAGATRSASGVYRAEAVTGIFLTPFLPALKDGDSLRVQDEEFSGKRL